MTHSRLLPSRGKVFLQLHLVDKDASKVESADPDVLIHFLGSSHSKSDRGWSDLLPSGLNLLVEAEADSKEAGLPLVILRF